MDSPLLFPRADSLSEKGEGVEGARAPRPRAPGKLTAQPQVQVPAQGLWFWQLKTTLLLPQNVLQDWSSSGQVAHLPAAAGTGRNTGKASRPQAKASLRKVFFFMMFFPC